MSRRSDSLSSTLGDVSEMTWPAFAKPRIGNGNGSAEADAEDSDDSAMELDEADSGTRGEQSSKTHMWRGKANGHNIDSSSEMSSEDEASSDDCDDDNEQEGDGTIEGPRPHRPHRWRSRPPLLPQRMASLVSTVSGATRLSLEITSLFWEAIFDTIAESTSSGLWLGSAAWDEARTIALAVAGVFSPLSSLNPRIISRIVSSSTAAGYSMVNHSLTAAESLLEGGFTLYTRAINMSLHAAGEYVRFIDAVFGSTDTSRVLASFVHMCRREAVEKNPEIRALIKEHGLVGFVSQLLKTIAAWICLQVVTHGRERAYRMDLVHTNIGAQTVFCPRRFIDSDGKPLAATSATASAGRASSVRLSESRPMAATAASTMSPPIYVSGTGSGSIMSPTSQNGLLAVMPSENVAASDTSNHMHSHMRVQPNGKSGSHEHAHSTLASASLSMSAYADADAAASVPRTEATFSLCNDDEYSCTSDDDSVYYALSDQEVSHRDPEWDQQLIEALRNLTIQNNRQQQRHKQRKDGDTDESKDQDVEMDPDNGGKHPDDMSRSASKSSLWNTLAKVREAAAAAAATAKANAAISAGLASEATNSGTSENSSDSESSSSLSPAIPSVFHNRCLLPAFESAPASLVSSPQFPVTPEIGLSRGNPLHKAKTTSGDLDPEWQQIKGPTGWNKQRPGRISLSQLHNLPDVGNIEPLDGIPPAAVHEAADPMSLAGSKWMQQEFPRKPLLVNLARFISIASSAYGHSFMKVLGLSHGMIDARALIEEFGDFEVHEQDSGSRRVSQSGSAVSVDQMDCAAANMAGPTASGKNSQHSRSPSFSRLPRAQPMSAYHTHSAYNPSRPTSQRQYERRHFRSSRPDTPGGSRIPGRRPLVRRHHHRHRPVTDHPNHFAFSQHTGIPLSDLLFSSYVSPIVPGVTRAASAQASAVERKLRKKKSGAEVGGKSGKKSKTRNSRNAKNRGSGVPDTDKVASSPSTTPPQQPAQPSLPLSSPPPPQNQKGWLSAIPVVGTIYSALPSPASAFAAVPIIPGMVSRMFGSGSVAKDVSESDHKADQKSAESVSAKQAGSQREPTPSQFRRFDRIRQRLVYRNPSIHALVHYIAVDHATRSVVLACRGTLGISDLFVDMICEYETVQLPGHPATRDCQEFRVHSGMWHSALMLSDTSSEVFKEVAEALRLYPEYGLVLTGHSLGGGVASLLTLLWSQPLFDHNDPAASAVNLPVTPGSTVGSLRQFATADKFGLVSPRPIHCFSFGSPCSTNAALSYYCRGLVTSVANTDDFVTYLSVGACVDILNISAVLGRERGVAEKIVRRFIAAQRDKIGRKLNLFDFDFSKLRAYSYSDDEDVDDRDEKQEESKGESSGYWWSRAKTAKSSESNDDKVDDCAASSKSDDSLSSPPSKRQKNSQDVSEDKGKSKNKGKTKSQLKADLDDWHWSLVKTLRASMDSEKLYPPGDVFILASPGDDEVADKHLPKQDTETKKSQAEDAGCENALPSASSSSRSTQSTGAGSTAKSQQPAALPVGVFYCPDVTERFSELRFTRNMIAHHLPSTYERRISALIHETV